MKQSPLWNVTINHNKTHTSSLSRESVVFVSHVLGGFIGVAFISIFLLLAQHCCGRLLQISFPIMYEIQKNCAWISWILTSWSKWRLACYFDFLDLFFLWNIFGYISLQQCGEMTSDLKITSKMNKLLCWPWNLHQTNSFIGSLVLAFLVSELNTLHEC